MTGKNILFLLVNYEKKINRICIRTIDVHGGGEFVFAEFQIGDVATNGFYRFFHEFIVQFIGQNGF
jgi:hypothetical protein